MLLIINWLSFVEWALKCIVPLAKSEVCFVSDMGRCSQLLVNRLKLLITDEMIEGNLQMADEMVD